VRLGVEGEGVEEEGDLRTRVAHAEVAGVDTQGLLDGEEGVEGDLLRYDAEESSRLAVLGHRVMPQDAYRAGGLVDHPGHDVDQRRLAGAVGSEQGVEAALRDREVHVVQGRGRAVLLAQGADLDGWLGHGGDQ
jgi:hypothetical protein